MYKYMHDLHPQLYIFKENICYKICDKPSKLTLLINIGTYFYTYVRLIP